MDFYGSTLGKKVRIGSNTVLYEAGTLKSLVCKRPGQRRQKNESIFKVVEILGTILNMASTCCILANSMLLVDKSANRCRYSFPALTSFLKVVYNQVLKFLIFSEQIAWNVPPKISFGVAIFRLKVYLLSQERASSHAKKPMFFLKFSAISVFNHIWLLSAEKKAALLRLLSLQFSQKFRHNFKRK